MLDLVLKKVRLAKKLGIISIIQYKIYALKKTVGYFKLRNNIAPYDVSFLNKCASEVLVGSLKNQSDRLLYFFWLPISSNKVLSWYSNPIKQIDRMELSRCHWSQIKADSIFKAPDDDIKVVWEPSRFYWMPLLAMRYVASESNESLFVIYKRFISWMQSNHINAGVNWLCAQEASIRLVNYLLSQHILGDKCTYLLSDEFIESHSKRISISFGYARSQKNNHSLSEALAIYFSGGQQRSNYYIRLGYNGLNAQLNKLVLQDGTFSQYSVTYHCLVVEIITISLWVQKKFKLTAFSDQFIKKSNLVLDWLITLVDPISYDAPNLGANDTTALYKIDTLSYRDFRARIQTLSVILRNQRVYEEGPCDEVLKWLCVDYKACPLVPIKQVPKEFSSGGFVKFVGLNSWALLNYPQFKFRPSQADCMHFDLWVKGVNVLRDNGTYSYNAKPELRDYFRGIESHNTIQFDNEQPMPMLSRFLFGEWVKTSVDIPLTLNQDRQIWSGYYIDYRGCYHKRTVICESKYYRIIDEIRQFKKSAVIRWHLDDIEWEFRNNAWCSDLITIQVCVNDKIVKPQKYYSEQSLYYYKKQEKPALMYRINEVPVIVETQIYILA